MKKAEFRNHTVLPHTLRTSVKDRRTEFYA